MVQTCFTPWRYRVLSMKAETRQFRAKILNTCVVVTSVQRPCRTTASTQSTLLRRLVKGDAIDASPSCTSEGSRRSSSATAACSAAKRSKVEVALPLALPLLLQLLLPLLLLL